MADQPSSHVDRRPPPGPPEPSPAPGGRWLVCLNAGPADGQLVRTAGCLAEAARAEWFAVYVSTPHDHPTLEDEARVSKTLQLAAQLGGQAVKLSGLNPRDAILDFAQEQGVGKIVLAQPRPRLWGRLRARLPGRPAAPAGRPS